MNNLNETSNILTKEVFNKYLEAFQKSWGKDTAFYTLANEWKENNKALGQCTPTALIILDHFGGRLAYDKNNFHVWNILPDGTHQDFSRSQFKQSQEFTIYKYLEKEEVLTNEMAQINSTLEKYQTLKQRFEKTLIKYK